MRLQMQWNKGLGKRIGSFAFCNKRELHTFIGGEHYVQVSELSHSIRVRMHEREHESAFKTHLKLLESARARIERRVRCEPRGLKEGEQDIFEGLCD